MSVIAAPPLRDVRYSLALLGVLGIAAASFVLALVFAVVDGTGSLADPRERYEGTFADQARRDDLAWLAATLELYHQEHRGYPTTNGEITTLCASLGDPGCLLWSIEPLMLASDGRTPYYYASDGDEYTVYALMDRAPERDACPLEKPVSFGDSFVHCVVSPREGRR